MLEEFKEHFQNDDFEYSSFRNWYADKINKDQLEAYEEILNYTLSLDGLSSSGATDAQFENAVDEIDKAVEELNKHNLVENLNAIEDQILKEHN